MPKIDLASRKTVWTDIFENLSDGQEQSSKDCLAALIRYFSLDAQIAFDPNVEQIGYIIDYFANDIAPKYQDNKTAASQALLNMLSKWEEKYIHSHEAVGPITGSNVQDKFCQYVRYLIGNSKEILRDEAKTKFFFDRLLAY